MRKCSGEVLVDGVQLNIDCSVSEGSDIRVGKCYGGSIYRGGFRDGITKDALEKCESIVGLGVESGKGLSEDYCSGWMQESHGEVIEERTQGATTLEYEPYRKSERNGGRASAKKSWIVVLGKDKETERYSDSS
jgi:hypothetical protein